MSHISLSGTSSLRNWSVQLQKWRHHDDMHYHATILIKMAVWDQGEKKLQASPCHGRKGDQQISHLGRTGIYTHQSPIYDDVCLLTYHLSALSFQPVNDCKCHGWSNRVQYWACVRIRVYQPLFTAFAWYIWPTYLSLPFKLNESLTVSHFLNI